MAFSMADIVLEPFGGQIMGLEVATTTRLSALIAVGGLVGFAYASQSVRRGSEPFRLAFFGALLGIPAFLCVLLSTHAQSPALFLCGNFLIGLGAALFGHGTLTATLNLAPPNQSGLALGVWGAVQATGAGVGIGLSGSLRDGVNLLTAASPALSALGDALPGYLAVYGLELILLGVTLLAVYPLRRQAPG
jgi:BCD family chlorophyll transporter-like MFS transporter